MRKKYDNTYLVQDVLSGLPANKTAHLDLFSSTCTSCQSSLSICQLTYPRTCKSLIMAQKRHHRSQASQNSSLVFNPPPLEDQRHWTIVLTNDDTTIMHPPLPSRMHSLDDPIQHLDRPSLPADESSLVELICDRESTHVAPLRYMTYLDLDLNLSLQAQSRKHGLWLPSSHTAHRRCRKVKSKI